MAGDKLKKIETKSIFPPCLIMQRTKIEIVQMYIVLASRNYKTDKVDVVCQRIKSQLKDMSYMGSGDGLPSTFVTHLKGALIIFIYLKLIYYWFLPEEFWMRAFNISCSGILSCHLLRVSGETFYEKITFYIKNKILYLLILFSSV